MNSSLFLELTPEELSRIVDAALHTQVVEARLLTGGLFNTTYFVQTVDCGRVVLRVGPVNRHLLMPFEHRLMTAEEQVYALCRARHIPVSEVLVCDTTKTLIDRDYMIVRYIPSRPMFEIALSSEDRADICRSVGEATAAMHRITQKRFGRIADVAENKGFLRWSAFLRDELEQWETVAVPAALFTAEEHRQLRKILEIHAPLLDEIHTPCLVHTDLWEGNVLIKTASDKPAFAAIIDADRALWGDPDFEFLYQWMHNDDFLEGYGRPISQDTACITRRKIYRLLCSLWNAYVYQKEYNAREEMERERAACLELVSELL